tara:strand:- start:5 stop:496 length:492 start_codon:yes stop_codon:yes gene_type:complete
MASNQPTQAINVVKSDTINIPEPDAYITGANSGSGTTLTTAGAKFLGTFNAANTGYANRVSVGDVVYEGTTMVTIVSVDSDTQLTVSAALTGGGATYEIYRSNKANSEGFSLFVGGAGNIAVVPVSSDQTVIMTNVPDSSFIPLQVKRVNSANTTATNIIALR